MSKFNDDILLKMSNDRKEKRTFKGFANIPVAKAIAQLKKTFLTPENIMQFPWAHITVKGKVIHNYVQGVEIADKVNIEPIWYGKNISSYKLQMILEDQTRIGPFYSNSFASKKNQLDGLIKEFCEIRYKEKFISALIYDITKNTEKLAAKALYSEKKGLTIEKY